MLFERGEERAGNRQESEQGTPPYPPQPAFRLKGIVEENPQAHSLTSAFLPGPARLRWSLPDDSKPLFSYGQRTYNRQGRQKKNP